MLINKVNNIKEVIKTYDERGAASYSLNFKKNPSRKICRRLIRPYLISLKNKRVVDLGCGDGSDCIWLQRMGAIVTGIDISPSLIKIARESDKRKKIEWHVRNIEELSFKDSSFDLAISMWSLQYLSDLNRALSEWARVLKNNGLLIIVVPHPLFKFVRFEKNYFVRGKRWERDFGIKRFNYYYKFSDYFNSLRDANFEVLKIMETRRKRIGIKNQLIPNDKYPHDLIFISQKP